MVGFQNPGPITEISPVPQSKKALEACSDKLFRGDNNKTDGTFPGTEEYIRHSFAQESQ